MSILIIMSLLIFILVAIPSSIISKKKTSNINKHLECGFNKMSQIKNIMTMNFLSFMMMFLILEFEVVILIPNCKTKKNILSNSFFYWSILMLTMIMIYEWHSNSMKWNK